VANSAEFWSGTAGALIGAAAAGVIAIVSIYFTRRNDRKNLRDKEAFDAATRLLDAYLSVCNLLEARLESGEEYGEWLKAYLESCARLRKAAVIDGVLLPTGNLRDAVVEDADWLLDGFVSEMGRVELRYEGERFLPALERSRLEALSRVGTTARALINWRATGDHERSPLSPYTVGRIQEKAPGIWSALKDSASADGHIALFKERPLMPSELTFKAKLSELAPRCEYLVGVSELGDPLLWVMHPTNEGDDASLFLALQLNVLRFSTPPDVTYNPPVGQAPESAWAMLVADWLREMCQRWNRSPWAAVRTQQPS
jgi:hypothetical protein